MSKTAQLAKSIFGNWTAFVVSAGVAFFLSPFIVHHLGNIAYGVWTLVVSMISFMGLLDLGLRGAVTRFVARNHAQGNHLESSRAVSAAFWLRIWICLLILLTTVVLSVLSTRIFRIPIELGEMARWRRSRCIESVRAGQLRNRGANHRSCGRSHLPASVGARDSRVSGVGVCRCSLSGCCANDLVLQDLFSTPNLDEKTGRCHPQAVCGLQFLCLHNSRRHATYLLHG
jgi:hypothetical protein